jgi:hypothetical protein
MKYGRKQARNAGLPTLKNVYKRSKIVYYFKDKSTTPQSRVLLEKLIAAQLVTKLTAFDRTRRFITVFTRAHRWNTTSYPVCRI